MRVDMAAGSVVRDLLQVIQALLDSPATSTTLWITATLASYWAAAALYRATRAHPLCLPVVTGTAAVIALLRATGTSYETYFAAVRPLVFLLGPATVALAVPMHGQIKTLRNIWKPIAAALAVGSTVAVGSAVAIGWVFGAHAPTLVAIAPRSATMPIATSLAEHFGGPASLAAVAVLVTGVAGTMLCGPVLRWVVRSEDEAVQGFALGLTAHAIGTGRALQISERAGAYAALGMGLNGLLTAVLMPAAVAAIALLGAGG